MSDKPLIAVSGPPKVSKSILVDWLAGQLKMHRVVTETDSVEKLYYQPDVTFKRTLDDVVGYVSKSREMLIVDSLAKPFVTEFNLADTAFKRLNLFKKMAIVSEKMSVYGGVIVISGRMDWETQEYILKGGDSWQYFLDMVVVVGKVVSEGDASINKRKLYVYGRGIPPMWMDMFIGDKPTKLGGDGVIFIKNALSKGYPYIRDYVRRLSEV